STTTRSRSVPPGSTPTMRAGYRGPRPARKMRWHPPPRSFGRRMRECTTPRTRCPSPDGQRVVLRAHQGVQHPVGGCRDSEPLALTHHVAVDEVVLAAPAARDVLGRG